MEAKFVHECLVIDDFYSQEDCNIIIEDFEASVKNGVTIRSSATQRADNALDYHQCDAYLNNPSMLYSFTEKFWTVAWEEYAAKYPILNELQNRFSDDFGLFQMRIQKTNQSEGFHVFHHENAHRLNFGRQVVFTLYLNDVDMGGETEFLYKSLRIEPKMGRLVLWPSTWTYLHRGNPPLSGSKYIMTGWVEIT